MNDSMLNLSIPPKTRAFALKIHFIYKREAKKNNNNENDEEEKEHFILWNIWILVLFLSGSLFLSFVFGFVYGHSPSYGREKESLSRKKKMFF